MMASGDVADYTAAMRSAIVANFARVPGVAKSRVTLTVTAASVRLLVIIISETKAAAEAMKINLASSLSDAAAASDLMPAGFIVTSVPSITVAAPGADGTSLSSPQLGGLNDSTTDGQTAQDGEGDADLSVGAIVGAVAGGVTALLAAACIHVWCRQQRRRRKDGGGSSSSARRGLAMALVYGRKPEEEAGDEEDAMEEAMEEEEEQRMAQVRSAIAAAREPEDAFVGLESLELSGLNDDKEEEKKEEEEEEEPGGVVSAPVRRAALESGSASTSAMHGLEGVSTIATDVEAGPPPSSSNGVERPTPQSESQLVSERLSRARSVEAQARMRTQLEHGALPAVAILEHEEGYDSEQDEESTRV